MKAEFIILLAVLLDWLLGDPYWLPHPIRGIGWLIRQTEAVVVRIPISKRLQGVILFVLVVSTVFVSSWGLIQVLGWIHPWMQTIGQVLLIYTCLAARCLAIEGRKVMVELKKGDLPESRKLLSYLVGRDTAELTSGEVTRGAVETVAENIVDGVISPLFYAIIGGAPLALTYKAINTLDSMVGYKNDKYLDLGWASARMDDWANLIPARLTAVLIPLAALFYNGNWRSSIQIMFRDRLNHTSPNAGHSEAAVAGALQIELGGANYYFGKLVVKPTIGDPVRPLEPRMIQDTISLMYLTEILALVLLGSSWYLGIPLLLHRFGGGV